MKVSTSTLTTGLIDSLIAKGYQVEVHADEEFADITKPLEEETIQ